MSSSSESEQLQQFWKLAAQHPNVCIAGPSGASNNNRQIRVYAYGGFLCGIPLMSGSHTIDTNGTITLMSKDYIKYLDQGASGYEKIAEKLGSTPSINSISFQDRIEFLVDHFSALIAGAAKRFSSDRNKLRERNIQSAIAHFHQFGEHSSALVFDLETAVTKEQMRTAYREVYQEELPEERAISKPDYCVFLPDANGHPEFRLVELKCSTDACNGTSGLKKHAEDMTACLQSKTVSPQLKKLLSTRFSVVWKVLHPDRPLPKLDDVRLTAGFLFTDSGDLKRRDCCIKLCKEYIPKPQDFTYLYGHCPQLPEGANASATPVVDLARMVSWEEFQSPGRDPA